MKETQETKDILVGLVQVSLKLTETKQLIDAQISEARESISNTLEEYSQNQYVHRMRYTLSMLIEIYESQSFRGTPLTENEYNIVKAIIEAGK